MSLSFQAAKRGPKGNLQGGLRPCQHGIVIHANKAPPLAKIKLERYVRQVKLQYVPRQRVHDQTTVWWFACRSGIIS